MNSPEFSAARKKIEIEKASPDDGVGFEAANDPVFFEKFAEPLAKTRVAIESFGGTEEEKEYLRGSVALFGSVLGKINGWIDEAEAKKDFVLSKGLKALKTSMRFEIEEITNKRLID
jgi:hypothetical protein